MLTVERENYYYDNRKTEQRKTRVLNANKDISCALI